MTSTDGKPYFEFWLLDRDGVPEPCPRRINTATGIILNCHPRCDTKQVRHLVEIARQTRDYPVDICVWGGPEGDRYLIWSARIYYRSKDYGHERDNN
jgi:hypothetical protein